MSNADEPTARRPPRRRAPWSLRSIVVEVTGKPITDFQEARPAPGHTPPPPGVASSAAPAVGAEVTDRDPVEHIYPPLVGPRGREFHGPKREHHAETVARHGRPPLDPTAPNAGPLPEHPERLYLHYLLLHLDRLSLASLWYLRRQVNDEIAARARSAPSPPITKP